MSFEGRAGDPTRNIVQERLFASIGNKDTAARSTEIAVRSENELFKRTGPGAQYAAGSEKLVGLLKGASGFEVQRKLLMGAVAPEAWVQRHVKATAKKVSSSSAKKKVVAKTEVKQEAKKEEKKQDDDKADAQLGSGGSGQGANSAYYFFKSTDKEQAKNYVPKKLDASAATAAEQEAAAKLAKGQSKWNLAGATWEEADHSKWARRRLCELLEAIELGEGVSVVDDEKDGKWKVEGDAQISFSRGKRRVGFELKVKAKYTATHEGSKVKGKIELPCVDEVDGPDGDYVINILADKSDAAHTHVRGVLRKKVTPKIQEQVSVFIKEMYAR